MAADVFEQATADLGELADGEDLATEHTPGGRSVRRRVFYAVLAERYGPLKRDVHGARYFIVPTEQEALIGTGSTIGDTEAGKGVQATTAPFVIASAFGGNASPLSAVTLAALRDRTGAGIIGIRFGTTWPPYTASWASEGGSVWTLTGAAVIGSTTVPSPN